jgi:hypothetical protein
MASRIQAGFERVKTSLTEHVDEKAHERLRFRVLTLVLLFKMMNLFGGVWDIQWHVAIGRDSLWIPPHLLVMVAFVSGVTLVIGMLAYETTLDRSGVHLKGTLRLGPIRAPLAFYGIFIGYSGALLSGGFDELWHRIFGVDVTLWSPPHLTIMFFTMVVDYSLLIGLTASATNLGWKFEWRSPFFWTLAIAGAYTFEAANFQMAEAFVVGYRANGAGLLGLLFPILVGSFFPMSLLLAIRLSRRFWIAVLIFGFALGLQYFGVVVAAAGFAILRPVSTVEGYIRLNPASTIALARQFASRIGFNGLIGFEQAWTMTLSGVPLGLVSLLEMWPWARLKPLIAAPLYGTSLVIFSYFWFQHIPILRAYRTSWMAVVLATGLAAAGSLFFGRIGLSLARLAEKS